MKHMEMNINRQVRVGKVTLNVGAGKDQARLEKGLLLLRHITGVTPVKTFTSKRIPNWGIRPGLPIGCKVTLRHSKALELLPRLLDAKGKKLAARQFDNDGNIAFGIPEYIDIPQVKYDPQIGVIGLEVCITLERNGFRVRSRHNRPAKMPRRHRISRDEALAFMREHFSVNTEAQI